ncbi:MAG: formylglycine-generating enzyme family protein [Candidatus Nitrohelix vancouverensis]|uniref:Formylglycine-generating enzyme family protein n=1 Tax=Candidatus Nitrohelix vancouverensis TaxID=2705534 RepID=A0A7T0C3G5_9BACT|nr:MAG: formylglycine-generating enzyme family protein [Candidatus Nitrohelix vancouverensis]
MIIKKSITTGIGAFAMTALLSSSFAWASAGDMALVPGGSFLMGVDKKVHADVEKMSKSKQLKYAVSRDAFHDEGPAHNVVLDPFYMDIYETSNKQYAEFMKATGHPAPAYWDDHLRNKPEQPVSGVNWNDATAFCSWANKRLPTEAEWEKAARGPEGFMYPWGNEVDASKANFGRKNEHTANVTEYPEGKSGYGIYNMAGNVFEWVQDWYDPNFYKNTRETVNPTGPKDGAYLSATGTYVDRIAIGKKRVIRGGSWYAPAESITNTHRFWNDPMNNSYGVGLGFRCARSVDNDSMLQARTLYMDALIHMGAEKYPQALKSIEKALAHDANNAEYQNLKGMIQKQIR